MTARTFFSFLGSLLVGILVAFAGGQVASRVAAYFLVTENTALIAMTVIAVIVTFIAFRFAATLMNGGQGETFIRNY